MDVRPSSDNVSETPITKVAGACLIGTTIEFYDFFIYGTAAALVFPKLFFPEASPFIGTLLAFAAFGVGFVARPLGGVIFGHFGDRVGRKKMLVDLADDHGAVDGPDRRAAHLRDGRSARPHPAGAAAARPGHRRRRRVGRRRADGGRARAPATAAASTAAGPRPVPRSGRCWPPARSSSSHSCPATTSSPGAGASRSWPAPSSSSPGCSSA